MSIVNSLKYLFLSSEHISNVKLFNKHQIYVDIDILYD